MDYEKMYQDAEKAGATKDMIPTFIKFEKVDAFVVGRFVARSTVETDDPSKSYNQYLFDTNQGRVKFHVGSNGDKEFGNQFMIGAVYFVQYKGEEDIGRGRKVRKWNTKLVAPPEEEFVPAPVDE